MASLKPHSIATSVRNNRFYNYSWSFSRENAKTPKLDRFGRSLKDLVLKVESLKEQGIHFKSLTENIDTVSPTGKLQFHFFSALAEFERDIIRERTMAGLRSARARGRIGGRPKAMTDEKLRLAQTLMKSNEHSIEEICNMVEVSRSTLYRYLQPDGTPRN